MKTAITLIVILLAAVGVVFLITSRSVEAPGDTDAPAEESNNTASDTTSAANTAGDEAVETITYTDRGFIPQTLTVPAGTEVVFMNESSREFWPATNAHPTHTLYPGSSRANCDTTLVGSMFDACGRIAPDGSFSFVFDETGTWRYHDHTRANLGGTIVVE